MFQTLLYLEKRDYEWLNLDTLLKIPVNVQHQVKTRLKFSDKD